jgi:hypothetical protein
MKKHSYCLRDRAASSSIFTIRDIYALSLPTSPASRSADKHTYVTNVYNIDFTYSSSLMRPLTTVMYRLCSHIQYGKTSSAPIFKVENGTVYRKVQTLVLIFAIAILYTTDWRCSSLLCLCVKFLLHRDRASP